MITGDDGLVVQAGIAKEKTRASQVNEILGLTIDKNKIAEVQGGSTITKESLINELASKGLLTAEEVEKLKIEN